jgi:hypothetical protein
VGHVERYRNRRQLYRVPDTCFAPTDILFVFCVYSVVSEKIKCHQIGYVSSKKPPVGCLLPVCIFPGEEGMVEVGVVEFPFIRIRRAICCRWVLAFGADAIHGPTIAVRVQQLLNNHSASASPRPPLFEIAEELDTFLNFGKEVSILERWRQADPGQSADDYKTRLLSVHLQNYARECQVVYTKGEIVRRRN